MSSNLSFEEIREEKLFSRRTIFYRLWSSIGALLILLIFQFYIGFSYQTLYHYSLFAMMVLPTIRDFWRIGYLNAKEHKLLLDEKKELSKNV